MLGFRGISGLRGTITRSIWARIRWSAGKAHHFAFRTAPNHYRREKYLLRLVV